MAAARYAGKPDALRIVLDTNVLVSATINNGRARALYKKITDEQRCVLVLSSNIVREVYEVLSRPKFPLDEYKIT